MIPRSAAAALDRDDPLAAFRDRFVVADESIYLDGNSLGRLPRAALSTVSQAVAEEWGRGLVESWSQWIDLPQRVGRSLAGLLGAHPDEVTLADSTSVNLYKLASAAFAAAGSRRVILTDTANFPTDRYVLEGVAEAFGGELRLVDAGVAGPDVEAIVATLDGDVALASFSLVSYRSGALADLEAVTDAARSAGALTLWDLSHATGAVPIDLQAAGVDLAVGCTYKYLNGGPGAPAFLYVRRALQGALHQPIRGWFGHADQFAFSDSWRPAPGIERFLTGTPPILSVAAAAPGIEMVAEAGIEAIRAKSVQATSFLIDLYDESLAPLGVGLGTPRDPARRGSHVAFEHPEGSAISRWLRAERRVVTDFRAPATIRLAVAPLSTRYVELWDAVEALAEAVAGEHRGDATPTGRVT